jgi:signal peptidase II
MKKKIKIILFCLMSVAFIGCDQVTKELARGHLKDKPALSYYHDTFRLVYAENTGAFLSMGANWPKALSFWVMSIVPLLLLTALFVYGIKKVSAISFFSSLPFVLIFSGGVGNIIDRILYDRHVTDFMNLGINNFRTGIFNVADLCVTAGVIMLLILQFRKPAANANDIATSEGGE